MDKEHTNHENHENKVVGIEPTTQDKIYWHEASYEAIERDLHDQRDEFEFVVELLLSKEAPRIDMLVIKKNNDVEVNKNFGKIFRGHNIFEFKSETDYLSIDDYVKALGYAFFYSVLKKVPLEDITVSLITRKYPRKLMKYLADTHGQEVVGVGDGIYYIKGEKVPVQILEQKKLSSDDSLFLKNLNSETTLEEAKSILETLVEQGDLNKKGKYLETAMLANKEIYEEVLAMSEALREFITEVAQKQGWFEQNAETAKREIAIELLGEGMAVERIAKVTKLPLETVNKIQNSTQFRGQVSG